MTISNNGDYIYLAAAQHLVGYTLTKDANDLYCPSDGHWDYFINTATMKQELLLKQILFQMI